MSATSYALMMLLHARTYAQKRNFNRQLEMPRMTIV
jgi:hypothetical protein